MSIINDIVKEIMVHVCKIQVEYMQHTILLKYCVALFT